MFIMSCICAKLAFIYRIKVRNNFEKLDLVGWFLSWMVIVGEPNQQPAAAAEGERLSRANVRLGNVKAGRLKTAPA